jgi:hypothetical protein
MNILYEGLKQKGGMMVVPSTMVESMGPAGVMAATALAAQQQQQQQAPPRLTNGQPSEETTLRVVPDLPVFGGEG